MNRSTIYSVTPLYIMCSFVKEVCGIRRDADDTIVKGPMSAARTRRLLPRHRVYTSAWSVLREVPVVTAQPRGRAGRSFNETRMLEWQERCKMV